MSRWGCEPDDDDMDVWPDRYICQGCGEEIPDGSGGAYAHALDCTEHPSYRDDLDEMPHPAEVA